MTRDSDPQLRWDLSLGGCRDAPSFMSTKCSRLTIFRLSKNLFSDVILTPPNLQPSLTSSQKTKIMVAIVVKSLRGVHIFFKLSQFCQILERATPQFRFFLISITSIFFLCHTRTPRVSNSDPEAHFVKATGSSWRGDVIRHLASTSSRRRRRFIPGPVSSPRGMSGSKTHTNNDTQPEFSTLEHWLCIWVCWSYYVFCKLTESFLSVRIHLHFRHFPGDPFLVLPTLSRHYLRRPGETVSSFRRYLYLKKKAIHQS